MGMDRRWEQQRSAAIAVLNTLTLSDTIALIHYHTNAGQVSFPCASRKFYFACEVCDDVEVSCGQSSQATEAVIARLIELLDSVKPTGRSNFGEALQLVSRVLTQSIETTVNCHTAILLVAVTTSVL